MKALKDSLKLSKKLSVVFLIGFLVFVLVLFQNCSDSSRIQSGPIPAVRTQFELKSVNIEAESIQFIFLLPNDTDFKELVILRNEKKFPRVIGQGITLFRGSTEYFEDLNLKTNTAFYYSFLIIKTDNSIRETLFKSVITATKDETFWPNQMSRANSDSFISEHHLVLKKMSPQIMVLNFVNEKTMEQMHSQMTQMASIIRDSTTYHGYGNSLAEPFLDPVLAYELDLRDNPIPAGWSYRESTKWPCEIPKTGYWGLDYKKFFSEEFKQYYNIEDPDNPGQLLGLCQLFEKGLVHELWLYANGDPPTQSNCEAAELLERKSLYGNDRKKIAGFDHCAGNGCFDSDQEVNCSVTVHIAFFNHSRGPGCFLESLSHGIEGLGRSAAVPYVKNYFNEFANMNLNIKYGLPFESWNSCQYGQLAVSYPTSTAAQYNNFCPTSGSIVNYDPVCGNVHWMPNGRQHYDLTGGGAVLTSCEHFRDGTGLKTLFTGAELNNYQYVNDCMGPYLMWWRQSIPGKNNTAMDNGSVSMLNWWPFVYY